MSRILRRPMFRGGRVSSYGTGIAAPLVPGYRGGGQIGGGIIYGKPMADGRYGFQEPEITVGAELIEKNVPKANWENLVELEKFETVPKYDEDFLKNKFDQFVKGVERRVGYAKDDAFQTDVDLGIQLQPPMDPDDAAFWKIYNEDPDQAYKYWKENISTWGTKQKEQMEHAKKIGADVDYGIKSDTDTSTTELTDDQLEIERLKKLLAEKAAEPEVDAKTAVAENKELFRDLLGYDKAKGQDISDMLLGFAGAEGDDTWSKAKSFFRDEAKRPGRAQKISDAAGTLAIQDYIAGKRSKEQIEGWKGKIDYELEGKMKQVIPQSTDSLTDVAIKLSRLDTNINSLKGIKALIGAKDKNDPLKDLVYTSDIKIEDLEKGRSDKLLKKLKKGYNIIDDEGVKIILKYDGSGNINAVERFTISEFWNQKS